MLNKWHLGELRYGKQFVIYWLRYKLAKYLNDISENSDYCWFETYYHNSLNSESYRILERINCYETCKFQEQIILTLPSIIYIINSIIVIKENKSNYTCTSINNNLETN